MLIPRTLIFLTCRDLVLLLKGAPHKRLWANRYNGIGGHIERGEDVLSAAQRELKEETGLSIHNLRLCAVITIDTGQEVGIGMYVLRGEAPQAAQLSSAEGALEWFPQQDILQLPLVEDLPILLPRILSMQPHAPPFSAQYRYDPSGALQTTFGSPQEERDERWQN